MTPRDESDEFYVGYHRAAPPRQARATRRHAVAIVLLAVAVAAVVVTATGPFDRGRFEYGSPRVLRGIVTAIPQPMLHVARPGATGRDAWSTYLLVGEGKHGAGAEVAGHEGVAVELQGTLVHRHDMVMAEVVGGSLHGIESMSDTPLPVAEPLGPVRLRGEVVDAKCHLGVMNPGRLVPHRACATRCISGGVPPVLAVRDSLGDVAHLLLLDRAGRAPGRWILELVALPIEVRGELERRGELLVLRADASDYRKVK